MTVARRAAWLRAPEESPDCHPISRECRAARLFVANVDGTVTVLKAAGEWEILDVNDLGPEIHATPALGAGRIYVRTRGAVYCFGTK